MKNKSNFYKIIRKPSDDFFWKGFGVKKLGGNRIQLGDDDDEYDFSDNIQDGILKKPFRRIRVVMIH